MNRLDPQQSEQWSKQSRYWSNIGRPLRPGTDDIELFRNALQFHPDDRAREPVNCLIYGVTPELHSLAHESGFQVLAVDQNQDMIGAIWPGEVGSAILANWLDVPLDTGTVDALMCDGGLHLLRYRDEQQALVTEISRLVGKGGRVVFRLFLPSEGGETAETVLADLAAGKIPNLNCLKIRLGTAMMSTSEEGVSLHDIWFRLRTFFDNAEWPAVAAKLGWATEHLEVIEAYRNSPARYYFVSLAQALELFTEDAGAAFELASISYPPSIMGDRCPVVSFNRI